MVEIPLISGVQATWMLRKLWMTSFGTLAAWHCAALARSRDAWPKIFHGKPIDQHFLGISRVWATKSIT